MIQFDYYLSNGLKLPPRFCFTDSSYAYFELTGILEFCCFNKHNMTTKNHNNGKTTKNHRSLGQTRSTESAGVVSVEVNPHQPIDLTESPEAEEAPATAKALGLDSEENSEEEDLTQLAAEMREAKAGEVGSWVGWVSWGCPSVWWKQVRRFFRVTQCCRFLTFDLLLLLKGKLVCF